MVARKTEFIVIFLGIVRKYGEFTSICHFTSFHVTGTIQLRVKQKWGETDDRIWFNGFYRQNHRNSHTWIWNRVFPVLTPMCRCVANDRYMISCATGFVFNISCSLRLFIRTRWERGRGEGSMNTHTPPCTAFNLFSVCTFRYCNRFSQYVSMCYCRAILIIMVY